MRAEIRRIVDESKITTIYVTHDQKEALSLADAMVVMRSGKVIQRGQPAELYHRPNSRFTAEFLGETNFISGTVSAVNGHHCEITTPIGKLLSDQDGSVPEGKEVTLSIRPEAIHILRQGEKAPDGHSTIATTWNSRCFLGETAQHELVATDKTPLKSLELRPRDSFTPGSSISISIAPEDVVILDN